MRRSRLSGQVRATVLAVAFLVFRIIAAHADLPPVPTAVGPVQQVSSDSGYDVETAVSYDPTQHSNILAGSNTIFSPASVRVSGYQGAAIGPWPEQGLPYPSSYPNDNLADPSVAFDRAGNVFYSYLGVSSDHQRQLVVSKSTDKGAHWSAPTLVEPWANKPDKPLMAIDVTSGGQYSHPNRVYISYTDSISGSSQPAVVSYSDGGGSWPSQGVQVFDDGGAFQMAPAVGPNGEVYIIWDDFVKNQLLFAKSLGGAAPGTWTAPAALPSSSATLAIGKGVSLPNWGASAPACGVIPTTMFALPAIDVDRRTPPKGNVYVAWQDLSGGRMHIFFSRSVDGGSSWLGVTRIDTGNANDSWQPALAVDQTTGTVSLAWYDRRDDPMNTLYRVYYTQSTDGGATFMPRQIPVTPLQSDPTKCGTGDYMQMVAVDGVARPVWSDNSITGNNQVFTAQIQTANLSQGLAFKCTTSTIASGGSHSLALKSDGSVWAWGYNAYGQLGNGGTTNSSYPVQVSLAQGIASLAAASYTSFALGASGKVWSWGYDYYGELGNGGTTGLQPNPTPALVQSLVNVRQISAGSNHILALEADGTVRGWGRNNNGQVGNGTTVDSAVPVPVVGLANVVSVAAGSGDGFSVALRSDGTVWAWGDNHFGELGNGNSRIPLSTVPMQVVGPGGAGFLSNVVGIAASGDVSIAVEADGSVWAWGNNDYGTLGNGSAGTAPSWTPVQVVGPGGGGYLGGIVSGSRASAAFLTLKSDSTVWAWGQNINGQLGNGTTAANQPTPVQTIGSGGAGFLTAVELAGGGASLGLGADTTVFAWGLNLYGELGNGTTSGWNPNPTPARVVGSGGSGVLAGVLSPSVCPAG